MCHGEPGGCRDRILQGGLWGRFFYPISEAEIGISYMQRGRDRTPSFLAYRTKSVCENPYNTRYLLVL